MTELKLDALGVKSIWQPSISSAKGDYLLIVLHGRGDSAAGWKSFQSELGIENLSALLLNAPDRYYLGYSWYGLAPDQLPGILRSRALLDQILPEIHRQGYPPERCFLLGFSQGCLMTLEFGGRYPHRLAGYIGLSGFCYDPEALRSEASPAALSGEWLITHGREDDVLPIERTRSQMQFLKQAGFNLDYREYSKAHTLDSDYEMPYLREWIQQRM